MDYLLMQKSFFIIGALLGLIAVSTGAFGAHALRDKLTPDLLSVYEIGVKYQFYHALALITTALAISIFPNSYMIAAGCLFIAGTLIFSGSLYGLAFSGIKVFGAITPIGGLLLILGWGSLILGALWNQQASS